MIWGIDPASKKIAMFNDEDGHLHVAMLTVKKTNRNDELLSMRRMVENVLKADPDPVIYCEEPVLAGVRNIRSTILIAETVGMILGLNAKTQVVPVSSWKKATVGHGNASKDEVADWLMREHPGYARVCVNQDLIDAAAIYVYGRQLEVS